MTSSDVVVVTTLDVVVVTALDVDVVVMLGVMVVVRLRFVVLVVTVVCLLGIWDTLVLAFEVDEETILLVVVVEYEGFAVLGAYGVGRSPQSTTLG